jgi:hypothetical protein
VNALDLLNATTRTLITMRVTGRRVAEQLLDDLAGDLRQQLERRETAA